MSSKISLDAKLADLSWTNNSRDWPPHLTTTTSHLLESHLFMHYCISLNKDQIDIFQAINKAQQTNASTRYHLVSTITIFAILL